MATEGKDFYGKDVASAIKEACTALGVAQENLDVEVVETGSAGIFGLIRKKAHIRASVQAAEDQADVRVKAKPARPETKQQAKKTSTVSKRAQEPPSDQPQSGQKPQAQANQESQADNDLAIDDEDNGGGASAELLPETLELIKKELGAILELMRCPSTIDVEDRDGTAHCRVSPEYEEILTSQEGKTLDSLQYLLRKIISKKIPGRVNLSIDVGDYRQQRQQQLEALALEYSALVKENGKTQVISSLNPSERRVVHVALQDDPDIRSRSIGDGLFKKVLIYKPGKGRKNNNRKRPRGKSRKKGNSGSGSETS
jgi:spoIIIJ-associated protein